MSKMAIIFISLAPLLFLCASVAGQEQQLLQIFSLHHQDSDSYGVSVDLHEVSTSILMAESWLRAHVLSHYPSTNITTIVVSDKLLICDDKNFENQQQSSRLTLVAMENVYHSLVRWGLERKIKVSVFINSICLPHQSYLKPVFEFLEEINSTYTVKTHDEKLEILRHGLESMADLSVFRSKKVNVMSILSEKPKPTSRKLSFVNPESEVGYSVPSDAANTPLPPLIGVTSPPPISIPYAQPPLAGPMYSPPPHYGLNLPPCNPYPNPHHHHRRGGMAAPPVVGGGGDGAMAAPPLAHERLWCVAKPSVPSENLQEAMDYACGEGGADCEAISPTGSCYFPDSIVAHASYAFNSYWQKNKKTGGTCGFGGTAMLISSDPSFLQCHFTVE